jgi:hypothetical protein
MTDPPDATTADRLGQFVRPRDALFQEVRTAGRTLFQQASAYAGAVY